MAASRPCARLGTSGPRIPASAETTAAPPCPTRKTPALVTPLLNREGLWTPQNHLQSTASRRYLLYCRMRGGGVMEKGPSFKCSLYNRPFGIFLVSGDSDSGNLSFSQNKPQSPAFQVLGRPGPARRRDTALQSSCWAVVGSAAWLPGEDNIPHAESNPNVKKFPSRPGRCATIRCTHMADQIASFSY